MTLLDRVLRASVTEKPGMFVPLVGLVLGSLFLVGGVADFLQAVFAGGFGWRQVVEVPLSVLFIVSGVFGVGYGLLNRKAYRRSEDLRSAAADRAEADGASAIAEELRAPDRWDDDDRGVVFLDGERHYLGVEWAFFNLIWNGGLMVVSFHLLKMVVTGEEGAVFLALLLLPFAIIGVCVFVAMWRALRAPRMPDFVVIASPVYPVAKSLDVHVEWAFLGDQSQLDDLEELALGVASFDGEFLSKKVEKCAHLDALPRERLRAGTMTITLPEIETKGYLGGRLNFGPQGSTELLVRAKWGAGRKQVDSFILGQVTGA